MVSMALTPPLAIDTSDLALGTDEELKGWLEHCADKFESLRLPINKALAHGQRGILLRIAQLCNQKVFDEPYVERMRRMPGAPAQ
jgi:hypothetical protein